MRKLGLKLGLSCAALAACATTLVSTTFAWYTSNDTVKAEKITGKTNENDADDAKKYKNEKELFNIYCNLMKDFC